MTKQFHFILSFILRWLNVWSPVAIENSTKQFVFIFRHFVLLIGTHRLTFFSCFVLRIFWHEKYFHCLIFGRIHRSETRRQRKMKKKTTTTTAEHLHNQMKSYSRRFACQRVKRHTTTLINLFQFSVLLCVGYVFDSLIFFLVFVKRLIDRCAMFSRHQIDNRLCHCGWAYDFRCVIKRKPKTKIENTIFFFVFQQNVKRFSDRTSVDENGKEGNKN